MTRLLPFSLATYTLTTMSITFALYRAAVNTIRTLFLPGEKVTRGPWHRDSKLWPTLLLLITSAASSLSGLVVMAMYFKSVSPANKAIVHTGNIPYGLYAVDVFVWIATAVAYRKGKDRTDLWGMELRKARENAAALLA